jgi:cell division protein FtsQ
MFKGFFIKRNLIIIGFAIGLFSLIGFVENKSSAKLVNNVLVSIHDKYGNHFIDESDVKKLISLNNTDSIEGKEYREVKLKMLEKRIEVHKFVEDAQVYRDHKGNLMVEVQQRRPIGRIIQSSGPHAYIGSKGNILPISEKFTSRVLIIDGDNARMLFDSTYMGSIHGIAFLTMLNIIDTDPFLKAQIAQITLKPNGDLQLRPQVGNEVIEFGKPDDVEIKFEKIKIFYKKILQVKGFNKYSIVNLKFKDQIICE